MLLSCQQCRQFDQIAIEEFGVPGIVLMENAGRESAREISSCYGKSQVVILCGPGNNGGDGFVIARHLDLMGVPVAVLMLANPDRISGDAKINFNILSKTDISKIIVDHSWTDRQCSAFFDQFEESFVIVDALLGTGSWGELRGPIRSVVMGANHRDCPKVAIDIPTGLNGIETDDKAVFESDLTLTFVARKKCFEHGKARRYIGDVRVIDIGAPKEVFGRLTENR